MKIAIIPARKNSKRIKNKNIKNFYGKPIISYAIKYAKESKLFDRIIVSSDSKKIIKIAKNFGAEAPFVRPKKFSTDKALTIDVIKHAIKWLKEKQINPKYICCIYPASPLLKAEDLKKSFLIARKNKYDFIISSSKFSYPIERSFEIKNKKIKLLKPNKSSTMTQKLKTYYHDAGQFYWGRTNKWLQKKKLLTNNSFAFKLPQLRVQDIDHREDWDIAKKLFKLKS